MGHELSPERKRFLISSYRTGFVEYCGFEALELNPGYMEARVDIRDHHCQQEGFVHAGVMAALADHTGGYAAYTLVPDDCRILTVELKINYLRPAHGKSLICRANVIKPGRKLIIVEVDVFDQMEGGGEKLAAKVIMTTAVVPAVDLGK